MRLAHKLTPLLAAASVGPLLVSTLVTYPESKEQQRRQLQALLTRSAEALAEETSREIDHRLRALALAGDALPFNQEIMRNAEERNQALRLIYKQLPELTTVALLDAEGRPIA